MAGIGLVPGVRQPRVCGVITYVIGNSGQTLILTDPVIEHLLRYRQFCPGSREAGGQLFSCFEGKTIRIERATGPRPSDRRSLMSFVPNRLAERREVKRLFKEGFTTWATGTHTRNPARDRRKRTSTASGKCSASPAINWRAS